MKKNNLYRFFILLSFCFFSFIGVFLRNDLFAFDSYATWYVIRTGVNDVLSHQDAAVFIFRLFPDSLIFFKFFMFFIFFISICVLFFLVKNYFNDERLAWISIFCLLAFSPLMMFEFAKFENELFAYPLILLSFYFFIVTHKYKKLLGFFPLFLSFIFWLSPGYLLFFGGTVMEQRIFSGLLSLFGLLFCIPFIVFEKNKFVKFSGLFFLGLFMLVPKLFIFYIPFLLISIGFMVKKIESKSYDLKNFILVAIILFFGWNVALFLQQPTQNDWFLIEETIKLHEDTNYPIYNDWSVGHWLRIKGIETKFKSGGNNPDFNNIEKPFIALTQSDLDCNLHSEYNNLVRQLRIYNCD